MKTIHSLSSRRLLSHWLGGPLRRGPFLLQPHDWTRLTEEACQSGLPGVVLEKANQEGIDVPQSDATRLQSHALQIAASNLHISGEMEPILAALEEAVIPVMLLKGFALRLDIYPRPDLRPMGDVDVLIQSRDLLRAFEVLNRLGCQGGTDLAGDNLFPQFHNEVEFFTPGVRPIRIDLHVRPFRSLRVSQLMPDSALWEHAERRNLGRLTVLIPSPTLMFLHLAAHAAFHGFSRLVWLYDIVRLIDLQGDRIDWALVIRRAKEWGLVLPVREAIARIHDQFGELFPPHIQGELRRYLTTWFDRISLVQTPHDASSPIQHVLTNLLCVSGWRFRLKYLAALLRPGSRHLGDVYSNRHLGWSACAQSWRMLRGALRFLAMLAAPFRRFSTYVGRAEAFCPKDRRSLIPWKGMANR
ncbi:MAG: nucleotidyltransferase family protein [Planctomycetota bacterium]